MILLSFIVAANGRAVSSRASLWLRPSVLVMAAQYALQRLQQHFQMQWSVNHSDGAFSQRSHQLSGVLPTTGLSRSDDDRRWAGVEPSEQLQDPGACGLTAAMPVQGDFDVHQCDVDGLSANQIGCFIARVRIKGLHTHGFQQPGQLPHSSVFPPSSIGEQQVEPWLCGVHRGHVGVCVL